MTTFTDATKLAQHQRERAKRVHTSIEAGCKAGADIAMKEAVALTSGPTRTAKDLRKAGHPFARAGRIGRIGQVFQSWPLLPIGEMSGDLRSKWRVFKRPSGRQTVFRLQNMSPHGKYVLSPNGTKRMVDRGFWRELNRKTQDKARRARVEIHRAALKG